MTHYTVTAQRGTSSNVWVLQCVEHPGAISQVKHLIEAASMMKEAIAFVAQVPEDTVEITVKVQLPDRIQADLEDLAERKAAFAASQVELGKRSTQVVRDLQQAGVSGRDIAVLLDVSPQRVSQLAEAGR